MIDVSSWDFEQGLKEQGIEKYILDFWADWCGPCRSITPILKELEASTGLPVYKINVDEQEILSSKYGIRSIPAVFFMKSGEVVEQIVGAVPKPKFEAAIDKLKKA